MATNKEQLARGLSKFSTELYQILAEKSTGNVIMSPYSIAIALSLLSQGARRETFDEIKNGLHIKGDRNAITSEFTAWRAELQKCIGNGHPKPVLYGFARDPISLTVANKIYVKKGYELMTEFKETAEKKFDSEVELLDFAEKKASAGEINRWVEGKTNGKIKNIMSANDFDELTRLVLVNAVYFKGSWEKPFMGETNVKPFWINENDWIKVHMMRQKEYFNYGVFEELDAKGLEMNYASMGSEVGTSFMILLPNRRNGLTDLEAKLKDVNLTDLQNQMEHKLVSLSLPKFRVEYDVDLGESLKKMGISKMFNLEEADLGDVLSDNDPQLHVSSFAQKAFIDVNEKGTEACAIALMKLAGGGGETHQSRKIS